MFCFQCEQTTHGVACTSVGACGKDPQTAALQDLLVDAAKRLAVKLAPLATDARPAQSARLIEDALFATVTNVSFDPARIADLIREVAAMAGPACGLTPAASLDGLVAQGEQVGIQGRQTSLGPDASSLQELVTYGLKGMAAYAHHARRLGFSDPAVDAFTVEALAIIAGGESDINKLIALNLRCGEVTVAVLALLDKANTDSYGHPVPTPVSLGHVPGKAILVSGHDLADLKALLEQTEGTGINIYTHGEMLPAHGYPELKKHKHLVGHFGGAWMLQRKEFPNFPGAILMTTNCIQRPVDNYAARLFTGGLVSWPGIAHAEGHDYGKLIAAAKAAPGFTDTVDGGVHLVGFGHNAVLGVADTVINAVKSGALKRFALIGGCDGSEGERSYYTDLAAALPQDWAILTLGCGKFRVMGKDYGTIGGLPRLLDMGQCNDAYSAVKVALALAEAFECGVNDLPLSLVISWFEQKAVCVLLALLHLGVKNIRLGPALPAFVSPNVLKVLVDTFNVMPIGTVEGDIAAMAKAA